MTMFMVNDKSSMDKSWGNVVFIVILPLGDINIKIEATCKRMNYKILPFHILENFMFFLRVIGQVGISYYMLY